MTRIKIVNTLPPNFQNIVKQLPSARVRGVIFAYGDTIYNPSGLVINEHLKLHEEVHGKRQLEMGVERWWEEYLTDVDFRYHEELLAHRVEYHSRIDKAVNRQQRQDANKGVAVRLASSLYGKQRSWKQTKRDILDEHNNSLYSSSSSEIFT